MVAKREPIRKKHDLDPLELRNIFEVKGGKIFWKIDTKITFAGDEASGYNQQKKQYLVKFNYKTYRRSEIIYAIKTGRWPTERLKRINGDKTDDRFNNLIPASEFHYLHPEKVIYHPDKDEFTVYNQDVGTFSTFEKAKDYYINVTTKVAE